MSTFSSLGLVLDRYPEIRTKIGEALRAYYGKNADVYSEEALIGGMVAVVSSIADSQGQLAQGIRDAFSPSAAAGESLSDLVQLNGLRRKENAYSTGSVLCTAGTAGTTIPRLSRVSDEDEQIIWETDVDLVLSAGETKSVSITAVEPGPLFADVGEITKILTPVYSWESVENTVSTTTGQTEETDEALRMRRDQASRATGNSSAPAIVRNLSAIPSVESLQFHENNTDVVDSYGVPGGHVWAIIKGGADDEIAAVLAESVSGGVGMYGTTEVEYTEAVTGKVFPVAFSRPEELPIGIRVTVRRTSNRFPGDGADQIRQQIADFFDGVFTIDGEAVPGQGVGDDVYHTRLFSPANAVPGHYIVSLELEFAGSGEWGTANLPIDVYQRAVLTRDEDTGLPVDVSVTVEG